VTPTVARFDDRVAVEVLSLSSEGTSQHLRLAWHVSQPISGDVTVFLHVNDARGEVVSQSDGYPIGGLSAPRLWRAGDVVTDERRVDVPLVLAPGRYTLELGLYRRENGLRLEATGPVGQRWPEDSVTVGTLEMPGP